MLRKTELVVLQASAFCNINCKYCYLPERKNTERMPNEILEITLKKILRSDLLADDVMFLWHSGEPLAVGIPFYKQAIDLIKQHNIDAKKISNAVQTNATLLTDEWCDFFKKHSFRIGISLDGPSFLHDANRIGWNGKGTFAQVMKGVELLKKHQIPLAAICVITRKTLDYPYELLNFFVDHGFTHLSFSLEETVGVNTSSSINDSKNQFVSEEIRQKYAQFIRILFKHWLPIRDQLYIRDFVEMCRNITGNIESAEFNPVPQEIMELNVITIQRNGNISTYCPELAGGVDGEPDKFVIGNILEIKELNEIKVNANFRKIKAEIENGITNCKKACDYFKLCGGRSPSVKMYENKSFESTETKHCLLHRQTMANVIISELQAL